MALGERGSGLPTDGARGMVSTPTPRVRFRGSLFESDPTTPRPAQAAGHQMPGTQRGIEM